VRWLAAALQVLGMAGMVLGAFILVAWLGRFALGLCLLITGLYLERIEGVTQPQGAGWARGPCGRLDPR
jgi:hypothetical protein